MPPVKYPISIVADDGVTELTGEAEFTDPDIQPGSGPPTAPYKPTTGDDVGVLTDSTGDADLISGGDAHHGVRLHSVDQNSLVAVLDSGVIESGVQVELQSAAGHTVRVDASGVALLSEAVAGVLALTPAAGDGGLVITDNGAASLIGFYGAAPHAQPVIPATTPTLAQVITALVNLGLVVQHD